MTLYNLVRIFPFLDGLVFLEGGDLLVFVWFLPSHQDWGLYDNIHRQK